jgi:hypothetical protein
MLRQGVTLCSISSSSALENSAFSSPRSSYDLSTLSLSVSLMSSSRLTFILLCWLLCVEATKHMPVQGHSTLLTGNRFEANLRKRIDPDDERLNRALWAGVPNSPYAIPTTRSKIITYKVHNRKRANLFNPLIPFPNCVKCAGYAWPDDDIDVNRDLSTRQLLNKILPGGQNGQCLFYGQREKGSRIPSLSKSASELACNWAKTKGPAGETVRAIWVCSSPDASSCSS